MPRSAFFIALLLAASLGAGARAQDVPGIELCTRESDMARRTGCLQSNIDYLQKLIARTAAAPQQKLEAAQQRLETQQRTLDAQQQRLDAQQRSLDALQQRLDAANAEIAALKGALATIQGRAGEQAKPQPDHGGLRR